MSNTNDTVQVGKFIVRNIDGRPVTAEQARTVQDALDYLQKSDTARSVIDQAADTVYQIVLFNGGTSYYIPQNANPVDSSGYPVTPDDWETVRWNPNEGIIVKNSQTGEDGYQSPALTLAHELAHSIDPDRNNNAQNYKNSSDPYLRGMVNSHEKYATELERKIASELDEVSRYVYSDAKENSGVKASSVVANQKNTYDKNGTRTHSTEYTQTRSASGGLIQRRTETNYDPKGNVKTQTSTETDYEKQTVTKKTVDFNPDVHGGQCTFNETVTDLNGNPISKKEVTAPFWEDPFGWLKEKFKDLFPDPNNWLPEWAKDLADWLDDGKINRNGKYRIYDPITLDLNGDGIQALAANGFAGALFDHDNDGIRTASGWVSKEDGLLVRDLNGNGIIDNGSELFGDNTRLADGSLAAHGFVALAQLDSNSDGKVDASDKAFNELKVWIDADSDGISQANELRTLTDLDIQSLDVAYQDVNKDLGNGNSIRQSGSYTKTDGTAADMGDAWFASDKLYSRFIDKIDMTAEQAGAANDERYFQAA